MSEVEIVRPQQGFCCCVIPVSGLVALVGGVAAWFLVV